MGVGVGQATYNPHKCDLSEAGINEFLLGGIPDACLYGLPSPVPGGAVSSRRVQGQASPYGVDSTGDPLQELPPNGT